MSTETHARKSYPIRLLDTVWDGVPRSGSWTQLNDDGAKHRGKVVRRYKITRAAAKANEVSD